MAHVIADWYWKGGVGKTTVTLNLAACCHEAGISVGVFDFDPQANLTGLAGYDPAELPVEETVTAALLPENYDVGPLEGLRVEAPWGGWLVPASTDLIGAEKALEGDVPGPHVRLARAIEEIAHDTDIVFIDGPPRTGKLTFNILQAADTLLVPLQLSFPAVSQLPQLHKTLRLFSQYERPVEVAGYIGNFAENNGHCKEVLEGLIDEYGSEAILSPLLPKAVAYADAAAQGLGAVQWDRRSKAASRAARLTAVVLERAGLDDAGAAVRKAFPSRPTTKAA